MFIRFDSKYAEYFSCIPDNYPTRVAGRIYSEDQWGSWVHGAQERTW